MRGGVGSKTAPSVFLPDLSVDKPGHCPDGRAWSLPAEGGIMPDDCSLPLLCLGLSLDAWC